jgi:ABC-type spermidine/putrescine transport system permease subunit I
MRSSRHRKSNTEATQLRLRLGALSVPDVGLAVLVCIVPIIVLLVISFGRTSSVTLDTEITGTIESYRTLFGDLYRPVLARSFGLAALAVVVCVVVGTPAALALSRLSENRQRLALIAVMAPSFISFTVRVFAWRGLLGSGGPIAAVSGQTLLFRPPAVLIGMCTAYLPIYVLPAYAALSRVQASVLDAAADLGARRWRQTRSIVLPLAVPGLVTGAALVGVLAVGEFLVPAVLGGNKVLLLGSILADRGAGRGQPLAGAIVMLMLVTFAAIGGITLLARRRWTHDAS